MRFRTPAEYSGVQNDRVDGLQNDRSHGRARLREARYIVSLLVLLAVGTAWGQGWSYGKYDVSDWKPVFAAADSVIEAGDSLTGTAIRIDHWPGPPPKYLTMEIQLTSEGTPGLWGYLELSRDSLLWGPMLSAQGDTVFVIEPASARAVAGLFWVTADAWGGRFARAKFHNSGGDDLKVWVWMEKKP